MKKHEKYKDSGVPWIGEIPKDWKVEKLKRVLIIQKDISVKNNPVVLSLARDGVKVRDISSNEGQIASTYENYNLVKRGDLLLNPMDLISGANCSYSYVYGVISPAYFNLRAHKGYHTKYYDYFFKVQYWTLALFAHGKGVSKENRWTLNSETLKQYYVLTSNHSEQKKITDYLDDNMVLIDKLISDKQDLIIRLKEYRQTIINETVTKGLDKKALMKDSGIDWIGEIPEGWSLKKFKYLFTFNRGLNITKADLIEVGIPCVNYGEIHSKFGFEINPEFNILKFVDKNYIESFPTALLRRGDFIFADTSEDIEGSGNFTCLNSDIPTFAGYHTIVTRQKENHSYRYLSYLFESIKYRNQIRCSVYGVKLFSITQNILKNTLVLLPSKKEQEQISCFLDKKRNEINSTVNRIEQQITKLQEYKKSIISEAVTGKIKIEKYINEGVI